MAAVATCLVGMLLLSTAGLPSVLARTPAGSVGLGPARSLDHVDRVDGTPRVASRVVGLKVIKQGFVKPVLVTHAFDSRLFVVEQGGRIRILKPGSGGWTIPSAPFLDITSLLPSPRGGDQGLLGLAFHPDYVTNGRFFVYYTNHSGDNVVAEFHRSPTNPDRAVSSSRRTVLKILHDTPGTQHNGGMIAFGPNDGYLYIGTGDGQGVGGADPLGRAQNVDSLLGKMLRIDVTPTTGYAIPPTNPHADGTGDAHELVWSMGLRNPWRWSFDRVTAKLWIGDVGFNTYEEVSRAATGEDANFGWPCHEGRHDVPGQSGCSSGDNVVPFIEYRHTVPSGAENCAVTGGDVYRGTKYPSLVGRYVWTDFCSGRIWDVSATATSPATLPIPFQSGFHLSSFGEGFDGELYAVNLYSGGVIYRVVGQ